MIGKISGKTEIILEPKTIQKKKKIHRGGNSLTRIVTTTVGLLAASQGLGGVAARPETRLNGLAEPPAQSGVRVVKNLESTNSLPNNIPAIIRVHLKEKAV